MYISKQRMLNHTPKEVSNNVVDSVTIGTVVSTNDPQQMGRLKIVCTKWGDTFATQVDELPWATYISPFGGGSNTGARGPGLQESVGKVAYGFWAIPKVGAQVLVMCIDSDPAFRVYVGSMYSQFEPHTLPHGRYSYDLHPASTNTDSTPYGPLTSSEKPIEPLASNLKASFGHTTTNYEWQTRGADYQATGIGPNHLDHTESNAPDDHNIPDSFTDWKSTQGYEGTRYDPNELESKVISLTSPGFHSISMDDRQENCRLRFRTTSGHQILLDDTNERIYISTAKGENWVEMDQNGNIDIFSTNRVSIHSGKDINLTSDETVRIQAKKGIHLLSDADIRLQSTNDIHVRSGGNLRIGVASSTYVSTMGNTHIKSNGQILATSGGSMHLLSGGVANISAADTMNMNSGGSYIVTASTVHHNGPAAAVATQATLANEQPSFWTNRVPTHEPYARGVTKNDFTHTPEYSYKSEFINRVERGIKFARGLFWRR